jgi:cold shock CspA family protein
MTNDVVTTTTDSTLSAEQLIGRVKWFNNKAGYGFITVTDGDKTGTDVFVHHSAVGVTSQQYKYLVQGEYVEFKLNSTISGPHKFQAADVCGIKNGKLMCETRREFKLARTNYKSSTTTSDENVESSQSLERVNESRTNVPRLRGSGPRDSNPDWKLVKRGKSEQTEQTVDNLESKKVRGRGRPPAQKQV